MSFTYIWGCDIEPLDDTYGDWARIEFGNIHILFLVRTINQWLIKYLTLGHYRCDAGSSDEPAQGWQNNDISSSIVEPIEGYLVNFTSYLTATGFDKNPWNEYYGIKNIVISLLSICDVIDFNVVAVEVCMLCVRIFRLHPLLILY